MYAGEGWVKPIFAYWLAMMVCGTAPSGLHALASTLASSGVYTAQQAARGAELYQSKCSLCHGADLSGDAMSPPLAGTDFSARWAGQQVADLFDTIHSSMPSDQPGTLGAQQAADLVAFLLSSSRFPAGQTELPTVTDHLKLILIDKAPPASAN
jgi:quinoprotein glucose dehydrogenase